MKEVELGTEDENYEVIPLSPIRRLEERIKKLEKEREGFAYQGFMREILDLIQSNQKLVDEIVKANDQLRDEHVKKGYNSSNSNDTIDINSGSTWWSFRGMDNENMASRTGKWNTTNKADNREFSEGVDNRQH